jgi:hypothetical protein
MGNFIFHTVFIKIIIVMLLFADSSRASAQSLEQPSEQVIEETDTTSMSEVVKTAATTAESNQEAENYHIYRKENPDDPCDRGLDAYDYKKTWYDESQIFINSKFCEPALWFDNFFANDRIFKEGVAGTYVRWRNEFTYDEVEYFGFKMSLNFSVELPGINEKLRLTFESDQDENLRDIAPGNGKENPNQLGLQLDIKKTTRSKFNVSISLSPKIRFRYRYTYPVYEKVIIRFTQELERSKAVNSARSQLDYEHVLKDDLVFRSSTEGTISEDYDGIDWLQAFVLYQRLNKKSSLSYEAGVNGITEPLRLATNYRIAIRFRRNFHREWLFYEIAPEYTWPITFAQQGLMIETERRSKWLILFRLEAHFGNVRDKSYTDN